MRGQVGGLDLCRLADIDLRIGSRHGYTREQRQALERSDNAVGRSRREAGAIPVAEIAFLEVMLAVRDSEDSDVAALDDRIANGDAGLHQIDVGEARGPDGAILDCQDFDAAIRTAAHSLGQYRGTIANDDMACSESHFARRYAGGYGMGIDRMAV